MRIETDRLLITDLNNSMAKSIYEESQDEENRRFLSDEVFDSLEDAKKRVEYLIGCYSTSIGPLVYAVLSKDGTFVGHIQAVPLNGCDWEIGYHIGHRYRGQGYATEALSSFLPIIMKKLNITEIKGVCDENNEASKKVMEKCGFVCISQTKEKKANYVYYLSPKDIVVKFFEDGYTNHNYDFIMNSVSDTYIDHSPAGARSNRDAVGILKIVAGQFSSLTVKVLDVFVEGDMVASRVLYDGIHSGTCMGVPATGKRIIFEALENFRIEKGKIVESWGYWPDKDIEQKLNA